MVNRIQFSQIGGNKENVHTDARLNEIVENSAAFQYTARTKVSGML
jgi:hypothetical protein